MSGADNPGGFQGAQVGDHNVQINYYAPVAGTSSAGAPRGDGNPRNKRKTERGKSKARRKSLSPAKATILAAIITTLGVILAPLISEIGSAANTHTDGLPTNPPHSTVAGKPSVGTSVGASRVTVSSSALPVPASSTTPAVAPGVRSSSEVYSYSTTQPGPDCDKNGATWVENNIQFTDGCTIEATIQNQFGFLNVTLPQDRSFAQNNTVSITGSLGNSDGGYDSTCLGLEEDGSGGGGYLADYCNDGHWYIYTTSNEVIGHELGTGSIPMAVNGTTYQMVLALNRGTLNLTFNNADSPGSFKVAAMKGTAFVPVRIGIGYEYNFFQVSAPATNFVYSV